MTNLNNSSKAAKKAAKAEAKRTKKEAKAALAAKASTAASSISGPSPAERSAVAAERQVRLQRWRVVFALLMFLVAAATFLATVRPWEKRGKSPPPPDPAAADNEP